MDTWWGENLSCGDEYNVWMGRKNRKLRITEIRRGQVPK